jgi:hypothetical protein
VRQVIFDVGVVERRRGRLQPSRVVRKILWSGGEVMRISVSGKPNVNVNGNIVERRKKWKESNAKKE